MITEHETKLLEILVGEVRQDRQIDPVPVEAVRYSDSPSEPSHSLTGCIAAPRGFAADSLFFGPNWTVDRSHEGARRTR